MPAIPLNLLNRRPSVVAYALQLRPAMPTTAHAFEAISLDALEIITGGCKKQPPPPPPQAPPQPQDSGPLVSTNVSINYGGQPAQ